MARNPQSTSQEMAKIEDWTPYVLGEERLPISDPEDAQRDIQDQILNATNIDDILASGEAVSADDVLGVPLRILGSTLRGSSFASGSGCYCFIEALNPATGDRITVTCGGLKVITKLWQAHRINAYPFDGVFTSKDIGDGKTVKSIVSPARRVEAVIDAEVIEG